MEAEKLRADCCICFGIDTLVFPSHSTHIMQPFDLVIAAALKAQRQKETFLANVQIQRGVIPSQCFSAAGLRRWVLVSSFLEARRKTVTIKTSEAAFGATGLVLSKVVAIVGAEQTLLRGLELGDIGKG